MLLKKQLAGGIIRCDGALLCSNLHLHTGHVSVGPIIPDEPCEPLVNPGVGWSDVGSIEISQVARVVPPSSLVGVPASVLVIIIVVVIGGKLLLVLVGHCISSRSLAASNGERVVV